MKRKETHEKYDKTETLRGRVRATGRTNE